MEGSLNEGVELDNEILDTDREAGKALDQALFKEVVPGETPDLAPELDILGMVSKIRDLDYAQINLQNIGGISQEMALEHHHLVPSLISDDCPLGFYTKGVTKTRYSFALEAIQDEKRSIVATIIEAVVKMIKKIVELLGKAAAHLKDTRFAAKVKKLMLLQGKQEREFQALEEITKDIVTFRNGLGKNFAGDEVHLEAIYRALSNGIARVRTRALTLRQTRTIMKDRAYYDSLEQTYEYANNFFRLILLKLANQPLIDEGTLRVIDDAKSHFGEDVDDYINNIVGEEVGEVSDSDIQKFPLHILGSRTDAVCKLFDGKGTNEIYERMNEARVTADDFAKRLSKLSSFNPAVQHALVQRLRDIQQMLKLVLWIDNTMVSVYDGIVNVADDLYDVGNTAANHLAARTNTEVNGDKFAKILFGR